MVECSTELIEKRCKKQIYITLLSKFRENTNVRFNQLCISFSFSLTGNVERLILSNIEIRGAQKTFRCLARRT